MDPVWTHFQRSKHDGVVVAVCNYCEWRFRSRHARRLRGHLLDECPGVPEAVQVEVAAYDGPAVEMAADDRARLLAVEKEVKSLKRKYGL